VLIAHAAFSSSISQVRRLVMEGIGAVLLVIGIWLALQFIMRKAGLPT
jgi:hypothetical protein